MKENLHDIDYKCVNKRKRVKNKQVNDGDASNADERLSSTDKFQVKSFIPIMCPLEITLKKRATIYNTAGKRFTFLADLEASEIQLCEDIKFLMKDYPDDVDINFGEIKHFHANIKQNYSHKGHLCHQNL
jgi:hypothetical protein